MLLCLCTVRYDFVFLLAVFNKFLEPNSRPSATLKTNSGVSHPAVSNGLNGHSTMKIDIVPCEKHYIEKYLFVNTQDFLNF